MQKIFLLLRKREGRCLLATLVGAAALCCTTWQWPDRQTAGYITFCIMYPSFAYAFFESVLVLLHNSVYKKWNALTLLCVPVWIFVILLVAKISAILLFLHL
jgi:hypothetical protein